MALDGVSPGAALLYDSSGGMIFTPGIGQTSGGVGGTSLYTNVDALGSVHDTQTNGDYPRDQARFEAFGTPVVRTGSDPLPLGFAGAAGYQTDSDTGLMLLGNRYYDATVGRFITPDPAQDGDNWYAYCKNNPLGGVDPTGLSCPSFDSTGMSNADIDKYITEHGGEPGETYNTTDSNGNVVHPFTVPGAAQKFTFLNFLPAGVNIDQNIQQALAWHNSHPLGNVYKYVAPRTATNTIGDYANHAKYPDVDRNKDYHKWIYRRMGANFNFGAMLAVFGIPLWLGEAFGEAYHIPSANRPAGDGMFHPSFDTSAMSDGYWYTVHQYGLIAPEEEYVK